jgi:hypothetical protein
MFRIASMLALFVWTSCNATAGEYTIEDEFEGCDFDQLYALVGGGILECQQYHYF